MMARPTSGEAHSTGNAAGPKGNNQLPYQHTARRTVLARDTQRQTLLEALQRRPHHALELRKLGIKAPAARIGDLVQQGHDVDSSPTCVVDTTGHIHSTVTYTLILGGGRHE